MARSSQAVSLGMQESNLEHHGNKAKKIIVYKEIK
jgi:hypothetical protein